MAKRVAVERIPFGLWGLSSMRDVTRHPNIRVIDVTLFDPLWKHEHYFSEPVVRELIHGAELNETKPETSRFDWFLSNKPALRQAGMQVLVESGSFGYHWHNRWTTNAKLGSAYRLFEDFFDCILQENMVISTICGELVATMKAGRPHHLAQGRQAELGSNVLHKNFKLD
mmetsp:Transcript_25612/g.42304  ORF Transcript_25612/g.42304 Transcript_25612/m.42304 type:complete len:170 (-) Transcript_25612:393-902(-)